MWAWLKSAFCFVVGHRSQIESLADGLVRCVRCGAVLATSSSDTTPKVGPPPTPKA